MKQIMVTVTQVIEVPDSVEVIPIKDESGTEFRQLKFKGNLFMPYLSWMEYQPSFRDDPNMIHGRLKRATGKESDGWESGTELGDELGNSMLEEDYLLRELPQG